MPPVRDQYARKVILEHQKTFETLPGGIPPISVPSEAAPFADAPQDPISVGIIGAGVAGLFSAMVFEKMNKSLKEWGMEPIVYEILEAEEVQGPHPIGGRLWTHHFSGSENDYYDRGAMRFPDPPFMKPVMDLFTELGLDSVKIPYVMSIDDNLNFFNGKLQTNGAVAQAAKQGDFDPFSTGVGGLTGTVEDMLYAQIGDFRKALVADFDEGWEKLMAYDEWTTRGFMQIKGANATVGTYTSEVVDYLEAFGTGSGMYNQALSETVIDSLDFDYPEPFKWWTIQGGSGVIAEAMAKRVPSGKIINGARVTAISPVLATPDSIIVMHPGSKKSPSDLFKVVSGLEVTVAGETTPRQYSHVISTIPLGCFRMLDTSDCQLPWDLLNAIRSLSYDASTKIAIKFTKRWWEELSPPQKGGVSYTDRPTRVIVYPSYGIGGSDATILVSYTWAQDALRLGSYHRGAAQEKVLLDVILKDLSDIHGFTDQTYLPGLVSSHDVWPWYNYENSAGAFAFFGPSQFSKLYAQVTQPAVGGKLHFAGEATSVYHAWVLGALNSATRAVEEIVISEFLKRGFGNRGQDVLGAVEKIWKFTEYDQELLGKQIALGLSHKFEPGAKAAKESQ